MDTDTLNPLPSSIFCYDCTVYSVEVVSKNCFRKVYVNSNIKGYVWMNESKWRTQRAATLNLNKQHPFDVQIFV